MELFVTKNSPYARITRIALLELGMADEVSLVLAQTRTENSPYYEINPSGRVPYLRTADGIGIEDSDLICEYLCHLKNSNLWGFPDGDAGWELRRLHSVCRSFIDGLSVGLREMARPTDEQSPRIIAHEKVRAIRLLAHLEQQIDNPLMRGDLNRAQVTLYCALEVAKILPDYAWRDDHPKLQKWFDDIASRPSFQKTGKGSLQHL